ncbi:hypothetical protein L1987_45240 [Smallanthus sonchifolius]|uniref:Uncharacterized protein n=1 Tax=Smallanthus sonchifolius TaxID=185202 RepID=A0ACB9GRF9_9ASTR|nr:hypothetical protein L1987_45240 [Smallanthus sonchifolius]
MSADDRSLKIRLRSDSSTMFAISENALIPPKPQLELGLLRCLDTGTLLALKCRVNWGPRTGPIVNGPVRAFTGFNGPVLGL